MLDTIPSAQCARGVSTADSLAAASPAGLYELFLENVVLPCRIGVFDHEHDAPQRVRIDLLLQVRQDGAQFSDDIGDVLSYDDLLSGLKRILMDEHTNLVEMLAEKIARMCLTHEQVQWVRVSVAKLDIYDGVAVPGIRLERRRDHMPGQFQPMSRRLMVMADRRI
ncbi:dihydroneopterin aldolase (plasmid) [Azospirillum sp. B510]|uniref:dihydroneopterin aldolase n=1 Tax=Azospirillum sp. (strain B510) TaxID=137722 RepID=UPI0001C4C5E4|nr:dihydroneopterin aldolase [Azospirillum sp. B510]BAI75481.1 dihydroneopterin aldolase [Azospirillum sp. B510]